jgi:hypothetical protein
LNNASGSVWERNQVSGAWQPWYQVWTSAHDGAGSGLDADKLDGLDSSQLCRRVDLSSQVQQTSYRRSVIALCELTNVDVSLNSWSAGTIDFHRTNSLSYEARIDYSMAKKYNTTRPHFSAIYRGLPETSYRPCTFVYGGVKYGGIEFHYSAAEHNDVIWLGTGNFEPFGIDYYDIRGTVLNSEVNDSLNFSDPVISDHFYINSNKIWHAGNFTPFTKTTSAGSKTLSAFESCYFSSTGTATLPASVSVGDEVEITVGNFSSLVVARNGNNIMGLAENMTIDAPYSSVKLRYVGATNGWVIT